MGCYECALLVWSLKRSEQTPLHGVCKRKKAFILRLMARGGKTYSHRAENVSLLRNSPEQEDRVYTVSLSGEQRPFGSGISSSKLLKMGAKMNHCLKAARETAKAAGKMDHQLSPHSSSRVPTCSFVSLVGVKSSADESSAG